MQQEKLTISTRLKNRHRVFEDRSDAGRYLASMLAAIEAVRKGGAANITVAIPTSPFSAVQAIADSVDRIVCANMQDYGPFAVAAAYRRWRDLDLGEVLRLLQQGRGNN